jgi:hypothetical protein
MGRISQTSRGYPDVIRFLLHNPGLKNNHVNAGGLHKKTWKNLPITSVGRQFLPSEKLFMISAPACNNMILRTKLK